jgi:hypothetical protein
MARIPCVRACTTPRIAAQHTHEHRYRTGFERAHNGAGGVGTIDN